MRMSVEKEVHSSMMWVWAQYGTKLGGGASQVEGLVVLGEECEHHQRCDGDQHHDDDQRDDGYTQGPATTPTTSFCGRSSPAQLIATALLVSIAKIPNLIHGERLSFRRLCFPPWNPRALFVHIFHGETCSCALTFLHPVESMFSSALWIV